VYPHATPVPFLEQAIVSFMRKVEREEVAVVALGDSNNKEADADVEVPCFREEEAVDVEDPYFSQAGKRANNAVATDPPRKT
jgi:hypothetical protein